MTFFYDMIFLCFISDATAEKEANSGNGAFVMYFSLLCCWLSFFLRPIVVGILWFISHDFANLIKGA
jgi:hypothetical protein